MKNFLFLFFALSVILGSVSSAIAQQQMSSAPANPSASPQQHIAKRPNLLQLLNLTPEQVQQIRLINQETQRQTREANQRQRQARRALDEAIYADVPNQAEVDLRLKEFVDAQAETVRLRSQVEFRIRQVLNPEQLVRFRELRLNVGQNLQNWRQKFQQRRQQFKP